MSIQAVLLPLLVEVALTFVLLFWMAFILTRPLGATAGDLLDKPIASGGMNFSRPLASLIMAVAILVCILVFPQRAGSHAAPATSS